MSKYEELKNALGYMALADLDEKDELIIKELLDRAVPKKPMVNPIFIHQRLCPICQSLVFQGRCCSNSACRQAIDWSKE